MEKPRHVSWPTTDFADLTARPCLLGKAGEKFAIEGLMLQLVKQMNRVLLGQSVVIRKSPGSSDLPCGDSVAPFLDRPHQLKAREGRLARYGWRYTAGSGAFVINDTTVMPKRLPRPVDPNEANNSRL